jgi:hypothetical protein
MHTTLTTTRRIIIGAAVAAALAAPGTAFAESPAEPFQPGYGADIIAPPPVGPADDLLPPVADPDDPEVPGVLQPPTGGGDDPGHGGSGDVATPPIDPVPPCEEDDTCPCPEDEPECWVCPEGEDYCEPCVEDDCETPTGCDDTECDTPTSTTPEPVVEEKPVISTDRPTFDTGDERSVTQAGLLGGAISLVIVGGTAVAVVRRPRR